MRGHWTLPRAILHFLMFGLELNLCVRIKSKIRTWTRKEMSKTDRIVFSGKEDFSYFEEQFEARIFHLKLNKILDETVDYRNFMPSLRPNASSDQKQAAIDKGKEISEEKQLHIWYELVQALDKKSVLFLRPCKGNGSKAWDVLRKRFKSFESPGCKN